MAPPEPALGLAFGLPDSRVAGLEIDTDGRPALVFPGQLRLPTPTIERLRRMHHGLWFPSRPGPVPGALAGIVNMCADGHAYRDALASLARWCPPGVPVFNHPGALNAAQGPGALRTLSRIDGLTCPDRIILRPRRPGDFREACHRRGFGYPVRVQATTDRGNGTGMLIKSAKGWGRAEALDWPGQSYHLTELGPGAARPHQRYRVCFVGQEARITAFPFSYGTGKARPAADGAQGADGERLRAVCGQLLRAIPLDFWTVELSSGPDKSLRLEHLWIGLPEMQGAADGDPSARLWPRLAPLLDALLRAPQSWRAAQRARPGTAQSGAQHGS